MSMDNPGASGGSSASNPVEEKAIQDASGAAERVRGDLDAVSAQAVEDAKAVKSKVAAEAGAVAEKAKGFANEQKDLAAGQITGIAAAISKVADELEGDQATTARYARDLAGGLERFGKTVEGKSVDELTGMAQQFGRTQPLAFLGAAALAGFVASRFAVASQHRTSSSSNAGSTYGSSTSGNGNRYSSGSGTSGSGQSGQVSGQTGNSAVSSTTGYSTGYTGGRNVSGE